jgi:hypothetical protein
LGSEYGWQNESESASEKDYGWKNESESASEMNCGSQNDRTGEAESQGRLRPPPAVGRRAAIVAPLELNEWSVESRGRSRFELDARPDNSASPSG